MTSYLQMLRQLFKPLSKLCSINLLFVCTVMLFAACASEDPNIVNPSPETINVGVRFINMVPDGQTRQLVLERNVQTLPIGVGKSSAVVAAPADSSLLKIYVGSTLEYANVKRTIFARNSVLDLFAVPSPKKPGAFDTLVIQNAEAVQGSSQLAYVRIVNIAPDSTVRYDVRAGCPSGKSVADAAQSFGMASLYTEQPPGQNVYTMTETRADGSVVVLGTLQCNLTAGSQYSFVFHRLDKNQTNVMLLKEDDKGDNPMRELVPVLERTASLRVYNVGSGPATVVIPRTSQQIVSNLAPGALSQVVAVPTCDRTEPDVFNAIYAAEGTLDSISLNVGQLYTAVTIDTGDGTVLILAPPFEPAIGREGKARVRVIHAAASTGSSVVAVGGRTNILSENGYTSGSVLASNIVFDATSPSQVIEPGELPITVSTTSKPTNTLSVLLGSVQADHDYDIVLVNESDGRLGARIIDETPSTSPTPLVHGVLVQFVNASTSNEFESITIGNQVENARIYYRNSISTSVRQGTLNVRAGDITASVQADTTRRTLLVYGEGGGSHGILQFNTPRNPAVKGQSIQRVINATADVPNVSVSFDSTYKDSANAKKLADNVGYGQLSPDVTITSERRGALYVYNADTKELMYKLPSNYSLLGSNTTLLITGKREKGYDVIVLQEF